MYIEFELAITIGYVLSLLYCMQFPLGWDVNCTLLMKRKMK